MLYGSFEKHLTTMLNICAQCCDVLDLKKRANFPHFQQPSHEFTSTSYTTNERSSFSIPATKSLKIFPSLVMRMRNEVDWKYRPMPWVFFDYDCKLFGAPAKHTKHTEQREIQLDLIFFLLCRRCRRPSRNKKHCAAFLFRFSSVRKKSKVSSEFQLLFSIFLCLLLSLSCQIYGRMPLRITQ